MCIKTNRHMPKKLKILPLAKRSLRYTVVQLSFMFMRTVSRSRSGSVSLHFRRLNILKSHSSSVEMLFSEVNIKFPLRVGNTWEEDKGEAFFIRLHVNLIYRFPPTMFHLNHRSREKYIKKLKMYPRKVIGSIYM